MLAAWSSSTTSQKPRSPKGAWDQKTPEICACSGPYEDAESQGHVTIEAQIDIPVDEHIKHDQEQCCMKGHATISVIGKHISKA